MFPRDSEESRFAGHTLLRARRMNAPYARPAGALVFSAAAAVCAFSRRCAPGCRHRTMALPLSTELRAARLTRSARFASSSPPASSTATSTWSSTATPTRKVKLFAASGLDRKRKDLHFDGLLSSVPEPESRDDLDQMAFEGWRRLQEIEFFHPKTRTLITGDLCCNFGPLMRLVAQGRLRQRLGPPTECRILGILRDRTAVRRSLGRILQWEFERVLPGHGEILHTGGRDAFEKDFARLLR
jgi:hypothetical protein